MRRKAIALVAALLLAGAGTFILVSFVQGAEDRAVAGEERTPVWLVTQPIPLGTPGEAIGAYVEQEMVLAKSVPVGAVGEDLLILSGFVTQVDLLPGEALIASRFVRAEDLEERRGDTPARREAPDPQMLQVPVRLGAVQALGGIITPGETVAIIATFDTYDIGGSVAIGEDEDVIALPDAAGEGETVPISQIIIHKAFVTEVQAETVPSFTSGDEGNDAVLAPATGFVVTFAVDPDDAERLVYAATYGELWLAYQDEDDYDNSDPEFPTSPVTIDQVLQNVEIPEPFVADEADELEFDIAPGGN